MVLFTWHFVLVWMMHTQRRIARWVSNCWVWLTPPNCETSNGVVWDLAQTVSCECKSVKLRTVGTVITPVRHRTLGPKVISKIVLNTSTTPPPTFQFNWFFLLVEQVNNTTEVVSLNGQKSDCICTRGSNWRKSYICCSLFVEWWATFKSVSTLTTLFIALNYSLEGRGRSCMKWLLSCPQ